jgi:ATP-binding cassette subfamily B protein
MDIRIALFHRFNALSLSYYDKRSTGSVMARITNDADNLWDFLMDGAPWFLSNLLTLVFTSVVLFRMNARLAALLLIPAPFIYMLTRWFMPRARSRFRQVWQRISKMYSALNSALNGMRVIKAFAQEERENRLFEDRNRKVFEASFAANAMWALYFPALGLLMGLGSYIIWLVGGYTVLHGGMTLGMLTAFSGYLMQFYAPFQNFSRALDWSTRSLTAAERVFEVLDTEPEIKEAADAVSMPEMRGAVEFENVSFSYDKTKHVLENFSLKVEPGEMIGLVGHSGAGKTTIINLLARFYDVNEGCIKIDGVDIRKIKQEDFRRQFGIVLQEPFLFPGTIRDNIAYAKPHATVEEIIQAAKAANCHEFILQFPDGYDTYVGERGQRLSGGERQRISIARAILHDPKILILDEATASVDTETEKQIQEAIMHLVQNRTTFAIAHRLSTLRHAHRLVVLQEGKMVECGTHDELMEKDGVYANLVRIQTEVNRIRAV